MSIRLKSGKNRRKDRKMVPINSQLWRSTYILTQSLFAPFFQVDVSGTHFINRGKGCILLPKHQCWQDIPLIGMAVEKPLYYIAKYELFDCPVARRLLQSLGGIPLNRTRPIQTRGAFRAAVEVLKKGKTLVIFPEGTYVQNTMGDGRSGMLRFILNRVQVPLIPVGLKYFPGLWRRKVCIRFGAPVKYSQSTAESMDAVMNHIALLSGLPTCR